MNSEFESRWREVSATLPDWSRERMARFTWDPSRALLASMRSYQRHAGSRYPWRVVLRKWAALRHRFWSVVTGTAIPVNVSIGGGLRLPHPNGVVIHQDARIGPNCLILQQVTIGVRSGQGVPRIGGHVDIGAGAKILGPITIGDHVLIGANAVVLTDVPDHCMAVGVPAVVMPIRRDPI